MNDARPATNIQRLRRMIIGPPRDVSDPQIFHHISLAVFLAWVGLGADPLSSSAYGPEEAYKQLGPHAHLSIILVAMMAVTIVVIAIARSSPSLLRRTPSRSSTPWARVSADSRPYSTTRTQISRAR